AAAILLLTGDVPREPHEMLRPGIGFGENRDHVAQRLLSLRDKIVADDFLLRIPPNLSGDKDLTPFGDNTVAEASGRTPVFRMQQLCHVVLRLRSGQVTVPIAA